MSQGKYAQALERLNAIIEDIEGETVDVDDMAKKVKEAVSLIKSCKDRIQKAEMEVKSVVEAFEDEEGS